eukprot:5890904-Amphidinium_carterae.1
MSGARPLDTSKEEIFCTTVSSNHEEEARVQIHQNRQHLVWQQLFSALLPAHFLGGSFSKVLQHAIARPNGGLSQAADCSAIAPQLIISYGPPCLLVVF